MSSVVLNATTAPARSPAQGSPVQATTSQYMASPVSVSPARTSRLYVAIGVAPSQRSGAPISPGTRRGSVYASASPLG